jgi:antitoxin component YwqK of YwqJK toxin-antitoxin module
MRNFILVAFIPIIFNSCKGDENEPEIPISQEEVTYCDCNELAFDLPYNNFYLEEPRNGFTGLCETYYGNGNLALSKNFKKGKVHGDFITYYESGTVHETKEFDVSFQSGDHFIYAEDGSLLHHSTYKWGKQIDIIFPSN